MAAAIGRLTQRRQFLAVADRGRRFVTEGLILQMLDHCQVVAAADAAPAGGDQAGIVRYGLTASKKVGKAVERNRARRRLRALAESLLPLHGRGGCDYVLIGRVATVTRPFAALASDLVGALEAVNAGRGGRAGYRRSQGRPRGASPSQGASGPIGRDQGKGTKAP